MPVIPRLHPYLPGRNFIDHGLVMGSMPSPQAIQHLAVPFPIFGIGQINQAIRKAMNWLDPQLLR
jgi:hypothetical protein